VEKLKIVLAEDHTILREGLRALLSADPGFGPRTDVRPCAVSKGWNRIYC